MNSEDVSLAGLARNGDDTAFAELLARYRAPILNFVHRLLGDATEAEEVAQEVFVRAYRRLADYNPRRPFATWLFAIARNAALDRLRYRQRHPTTTLDAVPEPATETCEVERRELGAQIAAAVRALPEDQRTAVVLAEYHGMSHREIATVMQCSVKSVEARLYRARQTLREKLAVWLK